MLKRFFLLIVCFSVTCFAQNYPKYLTQFENSIQLGNEQFYAVVQDQLSEAIVDLETKVLTSAQIEQDPYLSIYIASSFYYAFYTVKRIHFETLTLYDQVEQLRKALSILDRTIIFLRKENIVTDENLSLLFYARGFTKLYLSKQLLNAIVWKQYIVQPPRDIINLVESAKKDLHHSSYLFGLAYNDISNKFFSDNILLINDTSIHKSKPYNFLLEKAQLYKNKKVTTTTFMLVTQEDNQERLASTVSRFYTNYVFKTIFFLESSRVIGLISRAEQYVTYDEITSKENRPLFNIIDRAVDLVLPKLP